MDVPINEADLGKPIAVNTGLGVGPWFAQNRGVGVDWLKGGVGVNRGISIPFTGIGVGTGTQVAFPSLSKFAWLPNAG